MPDMKRDTSDSDGSPARKRSRHTITPVPIDASCSPLSIELFQRRGYIVIPSFMSAEELTYFQHESDCLYTALDDNAAVASDKLIENGCVLDTMATCPMEETASTRIDKHGYLQARQRQLPTRSISTNPFEHFVFKRLPTLVTRLLQTKTLFFFNEHYVVKPPHTNVEFRWHRDDDEQLAMCVHRDRIPTYVSAWCALDDVSVENGPLQFVPLDALPSTGDGSTDELIQHATKPQIVAAGDIVLFLSNVWHFSACNTSTTTRRAFYAQYSRECITATPRDHAPLSFAIPCVAACSDQVDRTHHLRHSPSQGDINSSGKTTVQKQH